jgi:hypothetical protein
MQAPLRLTINYVILVYKRIQLVLVLFISKTYELTGQNKRSR